MNGPRHLGGPGGQTGPVADPAAVVHRYLDRLVAHDWEALGACLAPDVVRTGPFGDTYRSRARYLGFLAGLLPTLADYEMRVGRTVVERSTVVVELTEAMTFDGRAVATDEVLVFDVDGDGLIERIGIYIRTGPPAGPPAGPPGGRR